ncbi:D-3-phosphoglycerate dehydrogenase [Hypoxylon trugodes]|uniref:D-3-phosphoglycerate dehydrogenase n=1 Tax=Hypoxylon trugodes TaxID=326681 RepID=UPI00218E270C|nr:D-3-phosphoglycerate dehydrogenase [Hypoxylon trugodes]KAI1392696.1 D-3-phosphoglycerate dehydrogenase [Hypoxylon trugodes]
MSGVVALDTFDPEGTQYMRQTFPDVIEPGHSSHSSWPEHAVGLFVAKSKVTADLIRQTKELKFIVRHGAGYDNIDAEACREKGVILCNLPGISALNVAEVALALVGACSKNLVEVSRQMRAGERLNKKFKSLYSATLLTEKTFGIIGGGRIGQLTAKKYIGAFDGKILMYDPYIPTDGTTPWSLIPHERVNSIEELAPRVDVLSLHVPLLPTTKDLITLPIMKSMKPTAILINVARGGVVNEEDLWSALRGGVIASAGVDAWVSEPPIKGVYGDVLELENLVMSPHIGGSPAEIQRATCISMVDHMKGMIDGKPPRDRVT